MCLYIDRLGKIEMRILKAVFEEIYNFEDEEEKKNNHNKYLLSFF